MGNLFIQPGVVSSKDDPMGLGIGSRYLLVSVD